MADSCLSHRNIVLQRSELVQKAANGKNRPNPDIRSNPNGNVGIALPFVVWRHFPLGVDFYIIKRGLMGRAPNTVFTGPQRWLGQEVDVLTLVYHLVCHNDR